MLDATVCIMVSVFICDRNQRVDIIYFVWRMNRRDMWKAALTVF